MFSVYDPFLLLAKARSDELRRNAGLTRPRYPDAERRPRLPFHWTNRA